MIQIAVQVASVFLLAFISRADGESYTMSLVYPTHQDHTLDPTAGVPFPISKITIQSLIKAMSI